MPRTTRDHTYLKVSELATEYHRSKQTICSDLEQIEKDPRYGSAWIYLHDGRPKMVNRNVYEDFLHYKTWLEDKNLRKHLKPFDPQEVRWQRGETDGVQIVEPSEEKIRGVVLKVMRGVFA